MGNIKQSFIKNAGKNLISQHAAEFSKDFSQNKLIVSKYIEANKVLRNKVAGYITRKMKTKDRPPSKVYIQKAIEKRAKSTVRRRQPRF
ncbi:MAG: 30S ribosomal protein S17e [archaeon]